MLKDYTNHTVFDMLEDILRSIIADAPQAHDKDNPSFGGNRGICAAIEDRIRAYDTTSEEYQAVANWLDYAKITWPKSTLNNIFPIPWKFDFFHISTWIPRNSESAYQSRIPKWKGKQLELRLDLINHMLKELESDRRAGNFRKFIRKS